MADNEFSSICSSSNPVDNIDDESNLTGEFPIEHWNVETEETDNFNVGDFNENNGEISFMDDTVCLQLPKFSKGYQASDFNQFVRKYVGVENLLNLKNGKYPNLWIMQVKTKEIREKLLRIWKTKIKKKTCWIIPYHEYELRGFLHWLPHFISDDDVKTQLSQYGDVLILENVDHHFWNGKVQSEVKYFGLRLRDGLVKNDMPHFLKIGGYRTLVIVRGRQPACFHCREFGHSKKDCKTYKEKLDEYCKNPEARQPRLKPRGRRHRPEINSKGGIQEDDTHPASISPQKPSEHNKYQLKPAQAREKLMVNKNKVEVLAILQSLKECHEETKEAVEKALANMEQNLMNSTSDEIITDPEFEIMIKATLDEIKRDAIEMTEKALDNLKKMVTEYVGLDSDLPLEKLISKFKSRKNEKSKLREVECFKEQLLSYHSTI